jgi:hypothetical protein
MNSPEVRVKRQSKLEREREEKDRQKLIKQIKKRKKSTDPDDDYTNLDEWLMRSGDVT